MRLFTIIPVTVLVLSFAAGAAAIVSENRSRAARVDAEPPSGMDILQAYACGPGETKEILVRGVEDGFSPAGDEPGFIREGRNSSLPVVRQGAGRYDQVNKDRHLLDSFEVAGPYSRGLFLLRTRALGANGNDYISFGDFSVDEASGRLGPRGGILMPDIEALSEWRSSGGIHHAAIEDIVIKKNYPNPPTSASERAYSLLSYLNDPDGPGWLDFAVADDTAVDFAGLALCSPPAVKRGVTLTPSNAIPVNIPGLVALSCHTGGSDPACDPYVGDTVCSAARPVACLKPGDAPAPVDADGALILSTWTGGTIAVTQPVAGTRFRGVRDVDEFCVQHFGPGWRVAELHDGFRFQSVSGLGDSRTIRGRVWVDIADQPHATCWGRN